jgi:hypothetical protein
MNRVATLAIVLFFAHHVHAQIINIEDMRIKGTSDTVRWAGSVKGSVAWMKIATTSTLLHGEARMHYRQQNSLTLFLVNSNILRADNEDFQNAHFAHFRHTQKITKDLAWEGFAQLQYNRLLILRSRTLIGLGLRYRLFREPLAQHRCYFGTALMPEWNTYLDDTKSNYFLRQSNYLSFTLRLNSQSKLTSTTYYQPDWTDWKNHRLATEWNLEFVFNKRFAFHMEISYGKDGSLPSKAPLEVYQVRNGLTVKLL